MELEKVAEKLWRMSDHDVQLKIDELKDVNTPKVQKMALDLCYSRPDCSLLGIPYERLDTKHFQRAKLAAYYVINGICKED
jgi:hypothetical protein